MILLTNGKNGSIIDTGGGGVDENISGASGAILRNDTERMDAHAKRYYEEIRKRKSDIAAIAKNTGFSVEDVEKVKKHVFIDTHDLGDEIPERFAPDYDMAVSWQRLIDGKDIQEMDIVLLNHELMEYELMKQGLSYNEAHRIAEKSYNYNKYIDELDKNFKNKLDERGLQNE